MKKLFCFLLALVMSLGLCACSKEKDEQTKKKETKNNVDRYFLYVEDNKLYRLDADEKTSQQIELDVPVDSISNAMVCDDNAIMVAKINNIQTDNDGVIYLGKKTNKAIYLGDNTQLVRMSKDGQVVFYLEIHGEEKDLYRYDAKKDQKEQLADNVHGVSVSEDGKDVFITCLTGSEDAVDLYYSENGEGLQKIAENVHFRVNASQDGSVVAYLKTDEADSLNYKAYTWSNKGKEQPLPFVAYEVVIFDEGNIYYVQRDVEKGAHYHYDGKRSHLLTDNGDYHGHKVGNYMYAFLARDKEGDFAYYIAHKDETIKTSMRICPIKGYVTFLSPDDKCVYGWGEDGTMYQVELNSQKELKETQLRQTGVYSPRMMLLRGNALLYPKDQVLYMNDEKITEDYEEYKLSTLGDVVVYKNGSTLIQYADGKKTEFPVDANTNTFLPAKDNGIVSWQKGENVVLQYESKGEIKSVSFGTDVTDIALVYTWTHLELSNAVLGAERTGGWFQRDCVVFTWAR